ncbi:EPM2AIP1, partial [Cordylochernes scorpioides]
MPLGRDGLTTTCLERILGKIEEGVAKGNWVIAISFDIVGAFDNLNWNMVVSALDEKGCPFNLLTLVRDFLRDRRVSIKVGAVDIHRIVSKGCPQGSCCGPILWNVVADTILRKELPAGACMVAYANDNCLIISEKSRRKAEALANESIGRLKVWAELVKLEFNAGKTKALSFKSRDVRAKRTCVELALLKGSREGEIFRSLHLSCVEPILLYGSRAWWKRNRDRKVGTTLESVQRVAALRITGGYCTTSTKALLVISGLTPVSLRLEEEKLRQLIWVDRTQNDLGIAPEELEWAKDPDKEVNWEPRWSWSEGLPSGKEIEILTDGSKFGKRTGAGIAIFSDGSVVGRQTLKLRHDELVYSAELVAIREALIWCGRDYLSPKAIYSDCMPALVSICLEKGQMAHEIADLLREMDGPPELYWVKGHSLIEANELADKLAKEGCWSGRDVVTPIPKKEVTPPPPNSVNEKIPVDTTNEAQVAPENVWEADPSCRGVNDLVRADGPARHIGSSNFSCIPLEKTPEVKDKPEDAQIPSGSERIPNNTLLDISNNSPAPPTNGPGKSPMEAGIVRTEKFEALKRGLKSQQSLFTKVKTEQEAATRASFRVALEIAKRGNPFTDGEMIKECILAVVEEMCPEKVNLLKTVSMSANTVARRVENIAENISSQLFDKNGHVEWFSLALDESTDVSDIAQVLIYIRGVDKSYEVHEELLDMYSIHGTTTGTDIFKGVEMAINKKNLRWKNLKCITTDGGKNMSGKDKGVVALVSKAVENDGGSKPLVLHCIIHQQSLCGKCLDMSDVLKPVISTVNFIRSFGLNHRQFRQFIAEIGETDLPYHTAVRWLSCGKVLQRFFELPAVIEIFLNEKHRPLTELQNNAWLWKLAFYVDLTKHVNELNLRLQGENQHLPDLYTNIKSFRMKLILFQSQIRSKCFSHFKTCEILSHTTETEFPIDFAIETLSALKINFDTRFSDFDAIANQIKIFQNPFDADIETLTPELQMEMIDLQCSDIIKNKYENSSLLEFYKSLPLTQFDNLHKFARGLFSVFGTTYLCEKTFSKMKSFQVCLRGPDKICLRAGCGPRAVVWRPLLLGVNSDIKEETLREMVVLQNSGCGDFLEGYMRLYPKSTRRPYATNLVISGLKEATMKSLLGKKRLKVGAKVVPIKVNEAVSTCFWCLRPGHIAKSCELPKRCESCEGVHSQEQGCNMKTGCWLCLEANKKYGKKYDSNHRPRSTQCSAKAWIVSGKIRCSANLRLLEGEDGFKTQDLKETLNLILDRHFGNEQPEDEISLTTCGLVDPPFSENEVKRTAFKFGNRKSPGPDGIDNTVVKALGLVAPKQGSEGGNISRERLQRTAELRITGGYRTTSTEALLVLAGLIPLGLKLEEEAIRQKIWEKREDALRLEAGDLEWKRDPRKPPQWLPKSNWNPGVPTGIGTEVFTDG